MHVTPISASFVAVWVSWQGSVKLPIFRKGGRGQAEGRRGAPAKAAFPPLNVETRNRKPMRPNPIAPWELRVGILRVYYDIQEQPKPRVTVVAVGKKLRNRMIIGGEQIEL